MNIIWMVVDTLRADRLGCYGYFRDTSPNIDRLAAEGVLFEDFYASAISTGAAFTGLFTGLPAISHRFYATPAGYPNLMNFDDTIPTLPEIIQANTDYTTVAVDNLINFAGHMKQTVRGFEFYINVTGEPAFPHPEYTAGEVNARFLPWLRAHSQEKFFTFIHFWDPHHNPYRAPGYRDRFKQQPGSLEGLPVLDAPAGYQYVPGWGRVGEIVWGMSVKDAYPRREVDGGLGEIQAGEDEYDINQDLYDCSIAYLDSQIQQILDVLDEEGILDETIIVFNADHGEGLGNHGVWGHGLPYDDTIHIPLILWQPGLLPEGVRVKGFAQHADIAPTILELMGIGGEGKPVNARLGDYFQNWDSKGLTEVHMEGRSLLPHARGEHEERDSIVTEVRRGPADPGYRALITKPWKHIENLAGERQLYNRDDDPMEKINLVEGDPSRAEAMSGQLHQWVQEHLPEDGKDPMRIW